MSSMYNLYNFEASFRNYLVTGNVSDITLRSYLSDIRYFLGWYSLFLKKVASDGSLETEFEVIQYLNHKAVTEYKTYLKDESRLPDKTINHRLSSLRKFCSFCISQGWLKENPAKLVANVATNMDSFVQEYLSVTDATEKTKAFLREFITFIN